MRKLVTPVLTLAVSTAMLAGCSSSSEDDGAVNDNPPAGTNANTDTADEKEPVEAVEVEETETEEPEVNPTFGQSYTWDNGLTVTVGAPEPFQPGEYAYMDGEGTPIRFTITVVNNTGANYEAAADYITLQSGNSQAGSIYDTDQLGDTPMTALLDGREAEYSLGFAVADPADLVMEFQPGDYNLDSVIFTS